MSFSILNKKSFINYNFLKYRLWTLWEEAPHSYIYFSKAAKSPAIIGEQFERSQKVPVLQLLIGWWQRQFKQACL